MMGDTSPSSDPMLQSPSRSPTVADACTVVEEPKTLLIEEILTVRREYAGGKKRREWDGDGKEEWRQ